MFSSTYVGVIQVVYTCRSGGTIVKIYLCLVVFISTGKMSQVRLACNKEILHGIFFSRDTHYCPIRNL